MSEGAATHVLAHHPALRAALARLLASAGVEARPHASSRELLAGARRGPACVLVDAEAAGVDVATLAADLRAAGVAPALVWLAPSGEAPAALAAQGPGACEVLVEPCAGAEILEAVRRGREAARRGAAADEERAELARRHGTLTRREREVFALVAQGLPNKVIGARLGASEKTVKIHRGRVMRKMGATSLAHLVRVADALGADAESIARGV